MLDVMSHSSLYLSSSRLKFGLTPVPVWYQSVAKLDNAAWSAESAHKLVNHDQNIYILKGLLNVHKY